MPMLPVFWKHRTPNHLRDICRKGLIVLKCFESPFAHLHFRAQVGLTLHPVNTGRKNLLFRRWGKESDGFAAVNVHRWMNEWMNERTNERTNEWMNILTAFSWSTLIEMKELSCKLRWSRSTPSMMKVLWEPTTWSCNYSLMLDSCFANVVLPTLVLFSICFCSQFPMYKSALYVIVPILLCFAHLDLAHDGVGHGHVEPGLLELEAVVA